MLTTFNSSSSCNSKPSNDVFLKANYCGVQIRWQMEKKKSEELNWYVAWMAVGICILSCNYKFVMLKNRMWWTLVKNHGHVKVCLQFEVLFSGS
jgi:hypothetical protein